MNKKNEIFGNYTPLCFEAMASMDIGTILYSKSWQTFSFRLVRSNMAPCAYLGVTDIWPMYGVDYNEYYPEEKEFNFFAVHGGPTYSGHRFVKPRYTVTSTNTTTIQNTALKDKTSAYEYENKNWVIGWDYGHYDDAVFIGYENKDLFHHLTGGRQRSLDDLLEDNIHIIESMIKYEKILTDKTKHQAILNLKSDDERLRYICRRRLKEKR